MVLGGIWVIAMVLAAPLIVTAIQQRSLVLQEFDQFSRALVEGRLQDAYTYCGSGFRAQTTFDEFVAVVNTLRLRHGSLNSVRQKGVTMSVRESEKDWAAIIKADFQFEKATRRVILEYRREDGRWVVFGFKETGPS